MTPNETAADLRTVNAGIAAGYDIMPFDPRIDPAIDPDRVLGVAALYGAAPSGNSALDGLDVLDLGCGTGVQLAHVGALTSGRLPGRLVGIDLSASACDRARERCRPFGERCLILKGDLAETDPASLGQFDLIYHVGVLYLTPPTVRARILALIAACLKPGGVAVISYFAGHGPMLMAGLNRILRAQDDPTAAPALRLAAARARIDELLGPLERSPRNEIMLQVLGYARGCEDTLLFHEMLNQPLSAIPTAALEAALARDGVHFLNWIAPGPFGATTAADERARIADAFDLTGGGYHYGLFAKTAGMARPDPRQVRWQTCLKRTNPGSGPGAFNDPATGRSVNIAAPATAAMLDMLAGGDQSWEKFSGDKFSGLADADSRARDVLALWQMGAMTPLRF